MTRAYRDRPDVPLRVVLHEPFPRSAAMVFVAQILCMAGGIISTTLSVGHRTELGCSHQEPTCTVKVDDVTRRELKLADVVEARVVTEPLSNGSLARLGLHTKDGATTTLGTEPHRPEVVAAQVEQLRVFLADPKARPLGLRVEVGAVRPSSMTFVMIAMVLLVPLALLLALRKSARVELDVVERSLRVVRRRGPFVLRTTRLCLDDTRAALLESKAGARFAYRAVLETKRGERLPIVDGWSPHQAAQQRTVAAITDWLEVDAGAGSPTDC